MKTLLVLGSVVALAISGGVAHGGTGRAGAVLVATTPTARDAQTAQQAITSALMTAGWDVREVKFSARETKTVLACVREREAQKCLRPLLQKKGLQHIAVVSLTFEPSTRELVITERLASEEVGSIAMSQRYCQQCTDDTLVTSSMALTKELLDQLAVFGGRTVLEVTSEPTGVPFFVDGKEMGITDKRVPIAPGAHVVRVMLAGTKGVERTIEGVEGETAKLRVDLTAKAPEAVVVPKVSPSVAAQTAAQASPVLPSPAAAVQSAEPGRAGGVHAKAPSRVGPVVLMAVGGVAVVGGVALFAMNEHAPLPPLGMEQPRYYYPTTLPASVSVASGVVALGVGYWWWRKRTPAGAPLVAPVAHGAVVGVSGTF